MNARTLFVDQGHWIPEQASYRYDGVLMDELEQILPYTALQSLTLTLYDLTGGAQAIINAVDHLDILNAGRGSLDAQGQLIIDFVPDDAVILEIDHPYEKRLALLEWTYADGLKQGKHEVEFVVRNLGRVL